MVLVISIFLLTFTCVAQQRISIRANQQTILQVLRHLEHKTNVSLFYNNESLKGFPPVSFHVKAATVDEILRLLFKDLPFRITHLNNTIAIIPDKNPASPTSFRTISGFVSTVDGVPLPQVSIMAAEGIKSTQSDNKGRFSIQIPAYTILQFSFIGMQSQQLTVATQDTLHVILHPAITTIPEVIINGYADVKRRYTATAATTIKANQLDRTDQVTVDNMLQGKVPGLNINMNSTLPGAAPKVRLRGTSTLLGNREPVWVIDGMISPAPMKLDPADINSLDNVNLMSSAVTGLNPRDIERIDVLKDAASAALYGINGGNGIIVITTKKGTFNKQPKVTFSQLFSLTFRPTYRGLGRMDAGQRIDLAKTIIDEGWKQANDLLPPNGIEAQYIAFRKGNISAADFNKAEQEYRAMNTDWYNILFNNGVGQQYNVSVNGGSSKTAYYASVGFNSQKGPAIFTSAKRYTALVRVEHQISKDLKTSFKFAGAQNEGLYPYQTNPYQYAYYTSRALPLTKDGKLYYYNAANLNPITHASIGVPIDTPLLAGFNILSEMQNSHQKIKTSNLNTIFNIDWNFLRNFKFRGLYGMAISHTQNTSFADASTFYMAKRYRMYFKENVAHPQAANPRIISPEGSEYQELLDKQKSFTLRHSIEYSITRNSHFVQALVGNEFLSNIYQTDQYFLLGYQPDKGKVAIAPDPDTYPSYSNFYRSYSLAPYTQSTNKNRRLSWYGMFVYSYKDRYTANINIREDGSNYFANYGGKNNQTWSAAFRWDVSSESWLDKPGMLSIHLSYGHNNGLPDIAPPRLTISSSQPDLISGEPTATINSFPNTNLHWEKTNNINAGVDFSFFNNRLSGTIEYYFKKSNDLIAMTPVPLEYGTDAFLFNIGGMRNYGIEGSLEWQAVRKKNWQWTMAANLSTIKSRITNANYMNPGILGNQTSWLAGNVILPNIDPDQMYAYKFTGLNAQGLPTFKGIFENDYPVKPTVAQYYANVYTPVGNRIPTLDGSFSTKITYRNWSFSAVFLLKFGYKQRLINIYKDWGPVPNPAINAPVELSQRWKQPGDEKHTIIPGFSNVSEVYAVTDYITGATMQWDPGNIYALAGIPVPLYMVSTMRWEMYNNSDIRIVNAGHIRLSTAEIRHNLAALKDNKLKLQSMSVFLQGHDLLLITNKQLRGQDPELPAGTMPRRPSLNFGIDITF